MSSNATRLTRFAKLLTASVGPLETYEECQAKIWSRHLRIVRPKRRTSPDLIHFHRQRSSNLGTFSMNYSCPAFLDS